MGRVKNKKKGILFSFQGIEETFWEWSKHHKFIGTLVKRVYKNGEVKVVGDEKLIEAAEKDGLLIPKAVRLIKRGESTTFEATDYYLKLENQKYEESNVTYYSIGAMNTSEVAHIRLVFQDQTARIIVEYRLKTAGSYALPFAALIEDLENIVDEILDANKPLGEIGIKRLDDNQIRVLAVCSETYEVIEYEIDKREFLNSLIAVEIFKFDQEIK